MKYWTLIHKLIMVKMSIIIWPQDRHWARSWSENMMPGLFLRMLQGVRWFREEPTCLIWVILHINWYLYLLRIEWVYNFNWVSDLSRFSIPRSLATPRWHLQRMRRTSLSVLFRFHPPRLGHSDSSRIFLHPWGWAPTSAPAWRQP